jgi:O-6-methylguanine DNA methyltransferase
MRLHYSTINIESFGVIYVACFDDSIVFLNTDIKALFNFAAKLKAELINSPDKNIIVSDHIKEYFSRKRKELSLNIKFLSGTNFEKKVWMELINIPYGKTSTYKEIAIKCQNEKALRAVGNAISKNPIPIIIPCHRIINSNGKLGGFSLGIDKKKYFLKLEKQQST